MTPTPILRFALLASFVSSCSCGQSEPAPAPSPTPEVPAVVAAETPAAAAVAAVGEDGLPPMVSGEALLALLPEAVGEWARFESHNNKQPMVEGTMLQVSGVYQRQSRPPYIYVSIADTRGIRSTQSSFREMHDRPTYSITAFEHEGHPAVEQFLSKPLNTVYMALLNDRYLVMVNAEGSSRETARAIFDAIDIKAVAALK